MSADDGWFRGHRKAFIECWEGRFPLGFTFWIVGYFGFGLVAVGIGAFVAWSGVEALALLVLPAWGYVLGSIWRSAGRYEGQQAWAFLARLYSALGTVWVVAAVLRVLGIPVPGWMDHLSDWSR